MLAIACNPIKTETTVDVTVFDQSNKPVAAGEKAYGKIYFENENFPDDYWFVIFDRQ